MPASPRQISATADAPATWPIGVPGSQTISVGVTDGDYADVAVTLLYGALPERPLELLSLHLDGVNDQGMGTAVLRDPPVGRWERAARAAAEHRLVTERPAYQHVDPDVLAEDIVMARFPHLSEDVGGNQLRRRKSLIHLAKVFQEYKQVEALGSKNPAQALAEVHGVSPGTVRSWLHRARKEGLAPESQHPNATGRA